AHRARSRRTPTARCLSGRADRIRSARTAATVTAGTPRACACQSRGVPRRAQRGPPARRTRTERRELYPKHLRAARHARLRRPPTKADPRAAIWLRWLSLSPVGDDEQRVGLALDAMGRRLPGVDVLRWAHVYVSGLGPRDRWLSLSWWWACEARRGRSRRGARHSRLNVVQRPKTLVEPQRSMTSRS